MDKKEVLERINTCIEKADLSHAFEVAEDEYQEASFGFEEDERFYMHLPLGKSDNYCITPYRASDFKRIQWGKEEPGGDCFYLKFVFNNADIITVNELYSVEIYYNGKWFYDDIDSFLDAVAEKEIIKIKEYSVGDLEKYIRYLREDGIPEKELNQIVHTTVGFDDMVYKLEEMVQNAIIEKAKKL